MISQPNHASPFGCVVGLFGLMALTVSGFFWRGYFLAAKIEDAEKAESIQSSMAVWGSGSLVVGLLIFVVSWKMIRGADMSSPFDADKPKARF